MKEFQNLWTKISPKLAKFVWDVLNSGPYATGLDNGGTLCLKVQFPLGFTLHLELNKAILIF